MKILMKINERPGPNTEHESMRAEKKSGARRAACWRLIVRYPCVSGAGQHLLTEQSKASQLEQLLNYSNFHLNCLPHWCWDTRVKLGHNDVGTTYFPRTLQIPAEERDVPYQKGKYKKVWQYCGAFFCLKKQGSCKSSSSRCSCFDRDSEEDWGAVRILNIPLLWTSSTGSWWKDCSYNVSHLVGLFKNWNNAT